MTGNQVDIYVRSAEFGEVMVGSLFLSDADIAELTEIFRGRT